MRWPWNRVRRVDVGVYEPLPARAEPTVAEMADDASLIADSAVRLALTNRFVVAALRDDGLTADELMPAARQELLALADESETDARRLAREVTHAPHRLGRAHHEFDYGEDDLDNLTRRREVLDELTRRLRDAAADDELCRRVADAARESALDAITRVAGGGLPRPDADPTQLAWRREMLALDLQRLLEQRAHG